MTSLSTYPALNTDTCNFSGNKQEGKLNPEVILKRAGRKDAVCVWLCPSSISAGANLAHAPFQWTASCTKGLFPYQYNIKGITIEESHKEWECQLFLLALASAPKILSRSSLILMTHHLLIGRIKPFLH